MVITFLEKYWTLAYGFLCVITLCFIFGSSHYISKDHLFFSGLRLLTVAVALKCVTGFFRKLALLLPLAPRDWPFIEALVSRA